VAIGGAPMLSAASSYYLSRTAQGRPGGPTDFLQRPQAASPFGSIISVAIRIGRNASAAAKTPRRARSAALLQ